MSHRPTLSRLALAGVVLAVLGLLVSCSQPSSKKTEESPEVVLAKARAALNETEGIELALRTDDLPEGVQGLTAAKGVATHAPAFSGTISVLFAGSDVEVPVVAVDGKVYAQIPLTTGWSDVDPAEYGAPDPAELMDPDSGFSAMLAATTGLEKGESVRGGRDNTEILTEYTGTVASKVMKRVIPSSSGEDFKVAYSVSDDGELREARLTGVFYPSSPSMTYTVTFDAYGTSQVITAP